MIKVSIARFFTDYMTVFLVIPALAWLYFLRTRYRSQRAARRTYVCGSCQNTFPERIPYQRPRCPQCGALHDGGTVTAPSDTATKEKAQQ